MQIPMGLGMVVFALLIRLLRASSYAAAFQRGSDLSILLDGLLMTIPMVVWMILRGHGWRHSLEMGASMIVPGVAIILLGWLGVGAYLPWLAKAACPIMCSGMLVYMLYRRDHYTGNVSHATHAAHQQPEQPLNEYRPALVMRNGKEQETCPPYLSTFKALIGNCQSSTTQCKKQHS
jgi:hypothetical protein